MLNFILSFLVIFGVGVQGSLQKTLNKQNPKHLKKVVAEQVILTYQGQFFVLTGQQACEFFADVARELPVKTVRVIKIKKKKSYDPLQVSLGRYSHYILFELHNEYGGIDKVRVYIMTHNGKIVKIRL